MVSHQTNSIPSSFALYPTSKKNFFFLNNVYWSDGSLRASIEHGKISFLILLMLTMRSTQITHAISASFLIKVSLNSCQTILDHLPLLSAATNFESLKRCTRIGISPNLVAGYKSSSLNHLCLP